MNGLIDNCCKSPAPRSTLRNRHLRRGRRHCSSVSDPWLLTRTLFNWTASTLVTRRMARRSFRQLVSKTYYGNTEGAPSLDSAPARLLPSQIEQKRIPRSARSLRHAWPPGLSLAFADTTPGNSGSV